jgi:serine/threonine protein kinase
VKQRLLLSHEGLERYLELGPDTDALVGRSADAKLFLCHPSISRKHCILRATRTGVEVEDLGSRNACFVNGRRVVIRTMLTEGCVLQIGQVAFSVKFLDEPSQVGCDLCGKQVSTGQLVGTPEGKALCPDCASAPTATSKQARFAEAIAAAGFVVLEPLGGDPPAFKVERAGLGKIFVIKVISVVAARPEQVSAVRDEARSLARLEHEHVASIFDIIETQGLILLVVAFETAEPLEATVRRDGPLPVASAIAIARACALAVKYAGSQRVVHRELTPANVLVGADGRVRVTNFALARELMELSHSFSGVGEMDQVLYLAPEILRGIPYDLRVDFFGIGTVLLFGLTGRNPWGPAAAGGTHVTALMAPTPPKLDLSGVPANVVTVLEKLLAFDPAERPRDPDALIALLDTIATPRGRTREIGVLGGEPVIGGAFKGDELIEYLQLIELNSKTGMVHVEGDDGASGTIVVEQGRLHSAETSDGLSGLDAASRLVDVRHGTFHFTARKPGAGPGLNLVIRRILMDALRQRDERQQTEAP